jgi:hypothetical protein
MAANLNGHSNGVYTYDSFRSKKSPRETKFLWWCAGAHQQLLKQYPSEHTKYSGLGGVLLATFVLASISAGYALYSIFGNILAAIVFAIIWGLIIFNFDRFLVSTMRKYGITTRQQWLMALPRLALAILIGFTIARPLELKIFEKEINVKVAENMHKKIQNNDSLLNIENRNLVNTAEAERNRLMERKTAIEDTLHNLQQAYVQEADGTGGSMARGIEQLTRLKMDAYTRAVQQFTPELQQLAGDIKTQDSILANAKALMEQKRRNFEASIQSNVGFLERNKALSDLAREENSVFWTSLLLSLLIILIEAGPILSKMIMPVGPYDIALASGELSQMAAAENEMRREKSTVFDKHTGYYESKKEISTELMDQLTELQKKYIKEELEKWKAGNFDKKTEKASVDELLKKIQEQLQYNEEHLL